ncbi:MAG: GFA family protein [Cellvibrio sp.]|jgi:Uncharacterized conserved protein
MESRTEYEGACLCGAVHIKATLSHNHVGVCHCEMCRRWGGGPLFAVECKTQVSFDGDENITTFDSSPWAERGFCRKCGTHLFYRLKQENFYAIPVGLFSGDNHWVISEQIFIDHKPSFYSLAEKTKCLTGEEVFAQYAGE